MVFNKNSFAEETTHLKFPTLEGLVFKNALTTEKKFYLSLQFFKDKDKIHNFIYIFKDATSLSTSMKLLEEYLFNFLSNDEIEFFHIYSNFTSEDIYNIAFIKKNAFDSISLSIDF